MYKNYIKRLIDFIFALAMIIILSPLFLLIYLLVYFKLGSPVIFKQERPGLNENIFTMYKFRSMTSETDENGKLLPDEVRLTSFGKFLRNSSLDELPELFNILFGDMALIGPRPQLVRDMTFMTNEQRKRHTVRPGLTGLAQVNGRNAISWENKLNYDLEYIKNITLKNDVLILIKTFGKVFKQEDINQEGMATALDFGDYLLQSGRISKEEYDIKMAEADELLNEYGKI